MIHRVAKQTPILYLAFNNRVVEEMKEKIESADDYLRLPPITVKTFNSIGHGIWAKANAKNLSLNKAKTADILRTIIDEAPKNTRGILWSIFWDVTEAVGMAKNIGYIPDDKYPSIARISTRADLASRLGEPPDDLTWDLIDETLSRSIKAAYAGTIDFNDQIYMPALFGGTFPRFPLVKVDEAQDLSPANHAMLDKLVKGRIIAVGDPFQSIYAFRGAKQAGMADLQLRFAMAGHTLSTSFRCPQAVVEAARWRVPSFQWLKEGGHVESLQELEYRDFKDDSAILCRNNAPLFRLGIQLLAQGRSVQVQGSEIGPKVIGIMRKLGEGGASRAATTRLIEAWRSEKLAKGSKVAGDIADCMRVFADQATSLAGAIAYAEHLFAQRGKISLMTGHKAKGLEWDTVYHLDPWLIKDGEQEDNLRYVITTRAAQELYEIDSERIIWQ